MVNRTTVVMRWRGGVSIDECQRPAGADADFLADLKIQRLPQTIFFALYQAWIARLVAYQCAQYTGKYRMTPADMHWEVRRQLLDDCRRIEENIAQLRRTLETETQFNRQVELNMRIKKLWRKIAKVVARP